MITTKTKNIRIGLVLLFAIVVFSGCAKVKESQLFGHWGCETYTSCRINDDGTEKWETFTYELGSGHGYELWFRSDESAEFKMNDSPALIKRITGTFKFEEEHNRIVLYPAAMYTAFLPNASELVFELEAITDNSLTVHWTNVISEDEPFYEHFDLKKIN